MAKRKLIKDYQKEVKELKAENKRLEGINLKETSEKWSLEEQFNTKNHQHRILLDLVYGIKGELFDCGFDLSKITTEELKKFSSNNPRRFQSISIDAGQVPSLIKVIKGEY